jgi:hypothetical protein
MGEYFTAGCVRVVLVLEQGAEVSPPSILVRNMLVEVEQSDSYR